MHRGPHFHIYKQRVPNCNCLYFSWFPTRILIKFQSRTIKRRIVANVIWFTKIFPILHVYWHTIPMIQHLKKHLDNFLIQASNLLHLWTYHSTPLFHRSLCSSRQGQSCKCHPHLRNHCSKCLHKMFPLHIHRRSLEGY